jgi:hypothetical protein
MVSGFTLNHAGQGRRDSNSQPPVLETGALPIELRPLARPSVSGPPPRLASVARPRRTSLGALFSLIAAAFAAIAVAAALAGGSAWVIAAAAAILALWMGESAYRALR